MANNTQSESQVSGPQRLFSRLFWVFLACANLVTVAWIGWLLWQISPRPVVTDLAYQSQSLRSSEHGITTPAASGLSAESPMRSGAPIDTLRLETELKTPPASAADAAPTRSSAGSKSN